MPAISVDTFFACSLMVILVLAAMASTSKLLYPHINNMVDSSTIERYQEISKYMLLNGGKPSDWGQNPQITPETFGLAKANSSNPYELDIHKVSRLNSENLYSLTYAQIFSALRIFDVSFRMEIKPLFEVVINLTATFEATNVTIYEFAMSTERHGVPIQTELKCYVIAENYLETQYVYASDGLVYINVTLANNIRGPALFVTFAKATCNEKIVSFGVYRFEHNSNEPEAKGTFLRISPLNFSVNATYIYEGMNLSKAYALAFDYNTVLTQTSGNNQSTSYSIPHFLDSSPTLIVVTGWNSTVFFTEYTSYPQIPLQIGANFAGLTTLSNVFTNRYTITINSALYECTTWLGGPRK